MAFYSLEPFGPQAVNLNAGIVASVIANVNKGKDASPFEPHQLSQGDFRETPGQEVLSNEEMTTRVMDLAAALGAVRVKKKDKPVKVEPPGKRKRVKKIGD